MAKKGINKKKTGFMVTDNERFKVILHDARLISLGKLQMVRSKIGTSQPDLAAIEQDLEGTANRFNDPVLWMNPIPFEEDEITGFILRIDQCNPADLQGFIELLRGLLAYLKDNVLKNSMAVLELSPMTTFNLKVLDALLMTQRNISGRKVFFKNHGIDLDTDPQFLSMQQEQMPILAEYRKVLTQNQVQSTEMDVIVFNRIAVSIKGATVLQKFLAFYGMFTSSMKSKLPKEVNV